jgi:hypothetical protein
VSAFSSKTAIDHNILSSLPNHSVDERKPKGREKQLECTLQLFFVAKKKREYRQFATAVFQIMILAML